MLKKLHYIKILMGLTFFALVFNQGTAIAEDGVKSFWKVGTVLTYQGFELIDNVWMPYDQYVKCSGTVILPETQPNMYYLLEMYGRDSETMIMRPTPSGGRYYYYLGNEYEMLVGPVGTTWEATVQGQIVKGEIVESGVTLELPTGDVYSDLTVMNMFCLSCGEDPILMETHWLSPELGFSVKIIQWPPDSPFIEWLVSTTRN
jgi:hypothetical protein